jgi:hypothetical protein
MDTRTRYIIVEKVPNSTHGNSAVSLPRKPGDTKLRVNSRRNRL